MKRILSLMLLLIVFTGCSNAQNSDRPNGDDIMGDVCITEIEWCGTEWEQIQFPIDLNEDVLEEIKPIETDRSAIEVAAAIIEKLHERREFSDYTLISVIHSTEDDVWRFEYSIDQRNMDADDLIDCGCLYVAIDGAEGELIKAWLEK